MNVQIQNLYIGDYHNLNNESGNTILLRSAVPFKIGVSEMNIAYDWEKSAWTSLPLGMKVNKLVRFGKLPVMFSGYYEYNFQDDYVAPEWIANFTLNFLFPI